MIKTPLKKLVIVNKEEPFNVFLNDGKNIPNKRVHVNINVLCTKDEDVLLLNNLSNNCY